METSQIAQIGIGAVIVLIVLFMLVENVSLQRKRETAKAQIDPPSAQDAPNSRR
jgi:hypothetical protein